MKDIDETMDEIDTLLIEYVSAVDSYEHSNTCDKLTYLEQRNEMYRTRRKLLGHIRRAIEAAK